MRQFAPSLILFLSLTGLDAREFSFGVADKPFEPHSVKGIEIDIAPDGQQRLIIKKKSFERENLPLESLYLDFDRPLSSGRDGYQVVNSRFRSVSNNGAVGKAASFERPEHEIALRPPSYLFTEAKNHFGDFSIFLRMKPYMRKNRMDVIRKGGVFEGKLRLFHVYLEEGYAVFSFRNLFGINAKYADTVAVRTRKPLSGTNFSNLTLNYEEANGTLVLYLDGVEQERIFVTVDGKAASTPLTGKFHHYDSSDFQIGKGYLGMIDEMVLCNCRLPAATRSGRLAAALQPGGRVELHKGVFISKRYDIGFSASKIKSIKMKSSELEGTRLKFSIRYSDKMFREDVPDYELPFVPWAGKELQARYFQYRVELLPDAEGNRGPVFESVSFSTEPNKPPSPPGGLLVMNEGNSEVTLSFLRNPEIDVVNGGRYKIYYGLKKDHALGVIHYSSAKPAQSYSDQNTGFILQTISDQSHRLKTKDYRYGNRIAVTITNQMITENLVYTRRDPRFVNEYPLLQPDVPFYFWVTACDSAYDEAEEYLDHESGRSNIVIGRPR